MSTKIYDAYKLAQPYTLYQLNQKLDELRVEIQRIGIRSIREKAIELTVAFSARKAMKERFYHPFILLSEIQKHG